MPNDDPLGNRNAIDPLGNVVVGALDAVLDRRLHDFEAQITRQVAAAREGVDELRVNSLRGDMLSKGQDFSHFSGSPSENFVEWAKKLEKQMLLKGIKNNDDALKLIFLEFHLKGDALTKFENISSLDNPPATYAQFKLALERAFPNQFDVQYQRKILKERKQKRTETVTAYFNELEKLGRLAYPTLDTNARNTILESVFHEGLQSDIRRALKFKRFADLTSLIEEATFVEREILRDEAETVPVTRYSCPPQFEQVFAVQANNKIEKQIEQLSDKIEKFVMCLSNNNNRSNQNQNATNKSSITCYQCGKLGHYARDCKSKIGCTICSKFGHSAEECRAKCTKCRKTGHKSQECPETRTANQNNISGSDCNCLIDNDDPDLADHHVHTPTCSSRGRGIGPFIVSMILFLNLFVGTTFAQYQMCGTSLSGHALEIPKSVSCIRPEIAGNPVATVGHVYVPRGQPKHTSGYKCSIRTRKICTQTSFFGAKSIIYDQTEIETLTPLECKIVWENKMHKGQSLNQTKPSVWTTNNKLNVEYKWCCFDNCASVENLIIEEGQVATWDGNTVTSTFGDLGGCKANAGHCVMTDGVAIWDESPLEKVCPFEYKNAYKIKSVGSHMVIEELQAAFSIQNISSLFWHPNCPEIKNAYQTEQGAVVQLETLNNQNLSKNEQFSRDSYDTGTPDYDPLNAKLNFLEQKLHEFELQNFRNVWNELCRQAQRHLDLVWQMLRLDATLGIRAFLQRTDVVAEFTGDAITIWPCRKINATLTYKNYEVNGTCYKNLPVLIEEKLMFVISGGTDLIESSQEIDCITSTCRYLKTMAHGQVKREQCM